MRVGIEYDLYAHKIANSNKNKLAEILWTVIIELIYLVQHQVLSAVRSRHFLEVIVKKEIIIRKIDENDVWFWCCYNCMHSTSELLHSS